MLSRCSDPALVGTDIAVERRALASQTADQSGATTLDQTDVRRAEERRFPGFAEAYAAHGAAIYAYVRRMMAGEADAEDLALAAFEKALRAWDRRPPDGELRPWLFRIATNACLDELRRRRRVHWQPWSAFISLFHPGQVAPDNPEEEALRHEKSALVRAALVGLSPRDRAALILRECRGLPVEEIARALGISHNAAKVALFRARERLRSAYLELGGEPPDAGHANRPGRGTPADTTGGPTGAMGDPHA